MASPAPQITDAEFRVVRGPYRAGDESPRHKGWYFIGRFNAQGDPLFIRKPKPYWRTFQGLVLTGAAVFLVMVGLLAAVETALDRIADSLV